MVTALLETSSLRKNKISLTDYDYQKDIENRLLMAQFSHQDFAVLEEVLYSSLSIPIQKLAKNLDLTQEELLPSLHKLASSALFYIEKDTLIVDKERRKYFEAQIQKFEDDFRPGMEFLQNLLKKVPIHVLPSWYAISRTSDNIFDSLVEKHLLTPQIFQRYVLELNLGEPVLKSIIQDVYSADHFAIPSKALMEKYQISKELFEEYMLHLEFSFVCCISYQKKEGGWEEQVTPFYEWKEYLSFLKQTEVHSIQEAVQSNKPHDFSFVEDLSLLLETTHKTPLSLTTSLSISPTEIPELSQDGPYLRTLISKAILTRLAHESQGKLHITDAGIDWLQTRPDQKALYLYRHPKNHILQKGIRLDTYSEKALREAEKSIFRVLHKGWVLFDEFLKGVHVSLHEDTAVSLKRQGKNWKYALPEYSEEDLLLLKAVIFEWLFEAGLVQTGTYQGKDCFRVTTLGQTLFAR